MTNQSLFLIAQNIRSLYNVGALFRCADVFGVSKLYLCGYTGYPPRDAISKTALGAEEWMPWQRQWHTHHLIRDLKKNGVRIVALETSKRAVSLPDYRPQFPMALIVGNEKNGITKTVLSLADDVIAIPMVGRKESLNVAVAASVALYTLRYH